jgi:hypothetical protein
VRYFAARTVISHIFANKIQTGKESHMMKTINSKMLRLLMAALLLLTALFGAMPFDALASANEGDTDGGHDMFMGMEYIPFEGGMIPVTDERVLAVTEVTMPMARSGLPNAGAIFTISPVWQAPVSVTMETRMNEGAKMALCDNEKRSQNVASFSLAII